MQRGYQDTFFWIEEYSPNSHFLIGVQITSSDGFYWVTTKPIETYPSHDAPTLKFKSFIVERNEAESCLVSDKGMLYTKKKNIKVQNINLLDADDKVHCI